MHDPTTDPALTSWVESANDPATDFPIQSLPFGIFKRRGSAERARVGVAIGDQVIDVAAVGALGLIDGGSGATAESVAGADASRIIAACSEPCLNPLMRLGPPAARLLREQLSRLMAVGEGGTQARREASRILIPAVDCEFSLPVDVGDYSDFYASIHHATNVGRLFRPDNPLLPNYKWIPIGYHGRASSIVASGTPVVRPLGQVRARADEAPSFAPTRRLDYELEVGAVVAGQSALGERVGIDRAEQFIFGLCLINDWSARDVQAWEYQPLGPFLAKSFATSMSPWLVTLDALEPFRAPAFLRGNEDPKPLPHLWSGSDQQRGLFDISLEVTLTSEQMRADGIPAMRLSRGNARELYWSSAQMLAQQTSNGCNLRVGDLIASGTVSGSTEGSEGCLLERTFGGSRPLTLPTGEVRTFLEDGDEITLRGSCEREGYRRIGLGECIGRVVASEGVAREPVA